MKNQLLSLLKKTDNYLSGEEIGEKLGVTRAGVWKGIQVLRKEGYIIQAVTHKGYKLIESGDLLNEADVRAELKTDLIGNTIKVVDCVDSTNNYLRSLAFEGVEEGMVVIAHEQTGGKGRRGKSWVSKKGEGLWMSLLVKPPILPTAASKITLITGLSVCEGLRDLGYDVSIKWPNDIILQGKKVCGILAEMNAHVEFVDFLVIGIGVNTNIEDFPDEIKDVAISLKLSNGQAVKRSKVAASILNEFEINYKNYLANGFLSLKGNYENHCITVGQEVDIISARPFKGKALGVTDDGELVVEKADKTIEVVYSGEISVRSVL